MSRIGKKPIAIPTGVTVKVVDPDGKEVPAGDVGELWVKGPNVVKGFYHKKDWVPAGMDGVCNPATWTETDHRPTTRVEIYRMKVAGATDAPLNDLVKNGTIKLVINGELVNEGAHAEMTKGKILLQSEGAEIHFRDVMLKQLGK